MNNTEHPIGPNNIEANSQIEFLELLSYILNGKKDYCSSLLPGITVLKQIFIQARRQKVLPLIIDGLAEQEKYGSVTKEQESYLEQKKERARSEITLQAQKTADFMLLYDYLAEKGLYPIVMKGIICRDIYPQPEHRPSVDEDILIDPDDIMAYHEALLAYGLTPVRSEEDVEKPDEVSYENKETHLYIEVHKNLFSRDSAAYSNLNDCFEGAMGRSVCQNIYGMTFRTLGHTDHLLYLVLHAFKHFLYSGFGIRQVCDIMLFSEIYRDRIDWMTVRKQLTEVRAFDFTRAIYRIGSLYLVKENSIQEYLSGWDIDGVDEKPLLKDILDGGLYGASTMTRLHSSNMTLQAMANNGKGSASAKGVLRAAFAPLSYMQTRYSYLKKKPFLLPVAWIQRAVGYASEAHRSGSMMESIHMGNERIELLRKYHIIR